MIGRVALVGAGMAAAVQAVPSLAAIDVLRRRMVPSLDHLALTFDDGPDPRATPRVLDLLEELRVHATFFVLGARLDAHPRLGREIAERGHELAVHGWTHRSQLLQNPIRVWSDLARTTRTIETVTGRRPRFWRPPYGIVTGAGLAAARCLGMRPVQWTVDGQDWRFDATPDSIRMRIGRRVRTGAVVLLHDSDAYGAPGSWHRALEALPAVVATCAERGVAVGALGRE